MSIPDPFGDAAAEDAPAEEAAYTAPEIVTTKPVGVSGESGLSVTFKGDGTYSAPWLVPKYASVADALIDLGEDPGVVADLTQAQLWDALFKRTTKMAEHFAGLGGGKPNQPAQNSGGGGSANRGAPQGAQEAPGGEKRFCEHGEMVYKSGFRKSDNKPYALFSCTAPRDQQCKAQFPK